MMLVNGTQNAAGTAIWNRKLFVEFFLEAGFDFQITHRPQCSASANATDGLAFLILDGSTNTPGSVGSYGSGDGAMGLHGYGVEFDEQSGAGCGGGRNRVSIDFLDQPCNASIARTGDLNGTAVGQMADGRWHHVDIFEIDGAVSVVIDGYLALFGVPLPQKPHGLFYLGFSAGTGAGCRVIQVRNVHIKLAGLEGGVDGFAQP